MHRVRALCLALCTAFLVLLAGCRVGGATTLSRAHAPLTTRLGGEGGAAPTKSALAVFVSVERSERRHLRMYAYDHALFLFLESLNRTDSTLERVALVTPDVSDEAHRLLKLYGVREVPVEPINSPDAPIYWKDQFTKVLIWQLTEYARVLYYDSDVVFIKAPDGAIDACGEAELCAAQDTGLHYRFFNAGFLVLRPSTERLDEFKAHPKWNTGTCDQDFLNMWYANSWKTLDSKFDRMTDAGGVKGSEGQDLRALVDASVALHAKWWHLKVALPDARFIWNDPEVMKHERETLKEALDG